MTKDTVSPPYSLRDEAEGMVEGLPPKKYFVCPSGNKIPIEGSEEEPSSSEEKVQCPGCGRILDGDVYCPCIFKDCTPLVNHFISDDEVNRRLHYLFGNDWAVCEHIFRQSIRCQRCAVHYHESGIPDYCADPTLVLREMRKREDWDEFRDSIGGWKSPYQFVRLDLILDNSGKLAWLALEWIERSRTVTSGML